MRQVVYIQLSINSEGAPVKSMHMQDHGKQAGNSSFHRRRLQFFVRAVQGQLIYIIFHPCFSVLEQVEAGQVVNVTSKPRSRSMHVQYLVYIALHRLNGTGCVQALKRHTSALARQRRASAQSVCFSVCSLQGQHSIVNEPHCAEECCDGQERGALAQLLCGRQLLRVYYLPPGARF